MRRLRFIQIGLLLFAFSCTTVNPIVHFEAMPKFDSIKADTAYTEILKLENLYRQIGQAIIFTVMSGVEIVESDVSFFKGQEDAFLYHKSVAALAIYHSEETAFVLHLGKAQMALDAVTERLGQLIETQKSI